MGLPGFPDAKTYVLLDHRPGSVFRWLQAADVPDLAFVVIDPLAFRPNYPLALVRDAAAYAGLDPDEEMVVLVLCTVPPPPAQASANFLAPLGIGRSTRRGAQVVLHDSGFTSSEPFLKQPAKTG